MDRRLAIYAMVALGSLVLALRGHALHRNSFAVPLDDTGDTIQMLMFAKTVLETGWHTRNPRLGAPGGGEMYDFTLTDSFTFASFRVIGWFTSEPGAVLNVYFLLTYLLAAVIGTWAMNRLGVSHIWAAVGGMLFAFLPYHQMRGEHHLFLSAYFWLPVVLVHAVQLAEGGMRGGKSVLTAAGCAAVLSCHSVYYAAFGMFVYGIGTVLGYARTHQPRILATGLAGMAVIAAGVVINAWPALQYQREFGGNASVLERRPEDADTYSLKPVHLVLPIADHVIPRVGNITRSYRSGYRPLENENGTASLGLFGTAGLLILACVLLGRFTGRVAETAMPTTLAAMTLGLLLLGICGGIGSLISFFVMPQMRCYNRVSILIGFFSLTMLMFTMSRWTGSWRRAWRLLLAGACMLAGLLDQTGWSPSAYQRAAQQRSQLARRYQHDREFFSSLEATMAPGAKIFQLPVLNYPEPQTPWILGLYEDQKPYLHTRHVRWSSSAICGREAAHWQVRVARLPTEYFLRYLVLADFEGLLVERHAFPDRAESIEASITAILGSGPVQVDAQTQRSFFDLRSFRDAQLRRSSETDRQHVCQPLDLIWNQGVFCFQEPNEIGSDRYGRHHFRFTLVNPGPTERPVELSMRIREPDRLTPRPFQIRSPLVSAEWMIDGGTPGQTLRFVLPPGRHAVDCVGSSPADYRPSDSRKVLYAITDVELRDGSDSSTTSIPADFLTRKLNTGDAPIRTTRGP